MDQFLHKIDTVWPELIEYTDLVRGEPLEHNKFCLLYNNVISRYLVLQLRNDEEDAEKLLIAWFRLISSTRYRRTSCRLIPLEPRVLLKHADAYNLPSKDKKETIVWG